jgi:hypothetical protein
LRQTQKELDMTNLASLKKSALLGGMMLSAALAVPSIAQAQAGPLENAVNIRSNQNLIGVGVGTGTKQGSAVATIAPSQGRPAIGVGAGSGQIDHFGSKGSVSVANNARLLGVDGAGGYNSPNSVSIRNPSQRPVLEPLAKALGK